MYKKILIPLDNSPTDRTILNHISQLGRLTKSELILIHVADGFGARLQDQLNLEDSDEIKKDKVYLEEIKGRLGNARIPLVRHAKPSGKIGRGTRVISIQGFQLSPQRSLNTTWRVQLALTQRGIFTDLPCERPRTSSSRSFYS